MARPEQEREKLLTALADRHILGIYDRFGEASHAKGGGGLKPIEHSPDGDATKTKYPVNYTGLTTRVKDADTIVLEVTARVDTRTFPTLLQGATGNFFHAAQCRSK